MIPPELVAHARAQGVVFTCAMCVNFWKARAAGLDECRSLLPGACSGPLRGSDYPHYDGVLKGHLHNACFVCGAPPQGVLKPKGGQYIGACNKHKEALFDYSGAVDGPPETADALKVDEVD